MAAIGASSSSSGSAASIGTTAASVGGSLFGAAIGAASSKRGQRRAYAYNKALMDYQNQINIENWQRENEYNTPQAQMARYQSAGLNPNLVAGEIGGAVGTAGDIGSVSPSGVSPSDFSYEMPFANALGNVGSQLNDYFVNKQRISDAHAKIAQTGVYRQQADALKFENHITQATLMETVTERLNHLMYNVLSRRVDSARLGGQEIDNYAFTQSRGVHNLWNGDYSLYDGWSENEKGSKDSYVNQQVELFKTNLKNDVATALYEEALHGLDAESVSNHRGYLAMLKSRYAVDKINADFEKSLSELDWNGIKKNPGKILMLIYKALGDAAAIGQPFLLNYQKNRYAPNVSRDYTEERYDPEKGSQIITRLYH